MASSSPCRWRDEQGTDESGGADLLFAYTEGADPGVPRLPLRVGSGRPDESPPKATEGKRRPRCI